MATTHTNLTVGKTYVVTSANGCTVTLANGVQIELEAGQDYFTPDTPEVTVSDDTATVVQTFNHAPGRRGSGGDITIDPTPTQGSENAVSSEGVWTALRELPAPLPTALTPTTAMKNGGVYTVEADIDASLITLPANATAEIWVRIGATTFNVSLPDTWVWVNGAASDMTGKTHTTFCIAVRNDGVKTLASIAYSYDTTPAQS